MNDRFTYKQAMFINEYVVDFNATAAARRAGYRGNSNTLGSIGSENLRKPKIQRKIKQLLTENAMTAEETLFRLTRQARGTMGDFITINEDGDFYIDLKKGEASGMLDLLQNIKITEDENEFGFLVRRSELKLYSSQDALQLLGRAHKLFVDRLNIEDEKIPEGFTADEYGKAQSEVEKWKAKRFAG